MPQRVDRPLITGALGLGALALALTWQPVAQSAGNTANTNASAEHTQPAAEREEAGTTATAADAPSFGRYRRLLELNPFSPRLPKKAPSVAAPGSTPPVIPPVGPETKPADAKKPETAPAGEAPKTPEPPDPLKDWVYSGTVAIGSDVYAVVENKASKQGRYVKVGDNLEGFTIDQVAQGELVVTLNGQPRNLAKSTAFNATPLNGGGGAPAGGPGGPSGPGGPGGPAGAPGGPGGPGGARPTGRPGGPVPAGVKMSAPVSAPVMMELATPVAR